MYVSGGKSQHPLAQDPPTRVRVIVNRKMQSDKSTSAPVGSGSDAADPVI